jgi:hypothetical protein
MNLKLMKSDRESAGTRVWLVNRANWGGFDAPFDPTPRESPEHFCSIRLGGRHAQEAHGRVAGANAAALSLRAMGDYHYKS